MLSRLFYLFVGVTLFIVAVVLFFIKVSWDQRGVVLFHSLKKLIRFQE